jgi:NAD dependent epimerase/dehydratase
MPSSGKLLVTGADGFIGSHIVELAVRAGYNVKAFVAYNSFNSWGWLDHCESEIINEIEIFAGDIRDPYGVQNAVKGCSSVIHLASLIAIPYSYHSPASYVDTNIHGTLNILQASRNCQIDRVIHTSTSEVYGSALSVPISEDHPLRGQSPYAATKIAADQLAYSFYTSFELPVVTLRPFNTYGPRQSARAVIPTIISQVASGFNVIKLGATLPTRDFNYVHDTADGFLAVLNSDAGIGEVVNLGGNFEISIAELANLILDLMGSEASIDCEQERLRPKDSEVQRLWADNSKIFTLFGWKPEYAGLEGLSRGLEQTIAWFSDPTNLKRYKSSRYNI